MTSTNKSGGGGSTLRQSPSEKNAYLNTYTGKQLCDFIGAREKKMGHMPEKWRNTNPDSRYIPKSRDDEFESLVSGGTKISHEWWHTWDPAMRELGWNEHDDHQVHSLAKALAEAPFLVQDIAPSKSYGGKYSKLGPGDPWSVEG